MIRHTIVLHDHRNRSSVAVRLLWMFGVCVGCMVGQPLSSNEAGAAGGRFNLVCQVTESGGEIKRPTGDRTVWIVDLEQQKTCRDDCKDVIAISQVREDSIVLIDRDLEGGGSFWVSVDRRSGSMQEVLTAKGTVLSHDRLKSVRATFSDFPKKQF